MIGSTWRSSNEDLPKSCPSCQLHVFPISWAHFARNTHIFSSSTETQPDLSTTLKFKINKYRINRSWTHRTVGQALAPKLGAGPMWSDLEQGRTSSCATNQSNKSIDVAMKLPAITGEEPVWIIYLGYSGGWISRQQPRDFKAHLQMDGCISGLDKCLPFCKFLSYKQLVLAWWKCVTLIIQVFFAVQQSSGRGRRGSREGAK